MQTRIFARAIAEAAPRLRHKPKSILDIGSLFPNLSRCSYQLLPVYSWRADSGAPALGRDKKLYFADPLMHTVAHAQAPGLAIDTPALVENAVAIALQRRYEPLQLRMEGFDTPTRLHVWRTRRSGEIDFVCGPHDRLAAVEVKYRANPDRRTAAGIARAFPGRPAVSPSTSSSAATTSVSVGARLITSA